MKGGTLGDDYSEIGITALTFIIGIVHSFLPMQKINEALFKVSEAQMETKTFKEAEDDFTTVKNFNC